MPDQNPDSAAAHPGKFVPDLSKSAEENVSLFWAHFERVAPEFTRLLKEGIASMTPLPEGAARTNKRTRFHDKVVELLDTQKEDNG